MLNQAILEEIDTLFDHHPPRPGQAEKYEEIRRRGKELATHLADAVRDAIAAIARRETPEEAGTAEMEYKSGGPAPILPTRLRILLLTRPGPYFWEFDVPYELGKQMLGCDGMPLEPDGAPIQVELLEVIW